mmetsp:Transcript_178762/g.572960  ORF Transcript_178762/g.572960 Transcript_178762/m.572960 type:complete len:92 (+) Transcript_178762:112-387(+)
MCELNLLIHDCVGAEHSVSSLLLLIVQSCCTDRNVFQDVFRPLTRFLQQSVQAAQRVCTHYLISCRFVATQAANSLSALLSDASCGTTSSH